MKLLGDILCLTWIELALIGWFIAFILHKKLNVPYLIKREFRWSLTKYRTFPDCYSCFTFWITLLVTFDPMSAIAAYLISIIIEKE
jgi:hypothetical protein